MTFLAALVLLLVLGLFVFEVLMFIHVIQNHNISNSTRLLWAIGMLFVHPFVAIGYLLTDYKKA